MGRVQAVHSLDAQEGANECEVMAAAHTCRFLVPAARQWPGKLCTVSMRKKARVPGAGSCPSTRALPACCKAVGRAGGIGTLVHAAGKWGRM